MKIQASSLKIDHCDGDVQTFSKNIPRSKPIDIPKRKIKKVCPHRNKEHLDTHKGFNNLCVCWGFC